MVVKMERTIVFTFALALAHCSFCWKWRIQGGIVGFGLGTEISTLLWTVI